EVLNRREALEKGGVEPGPLPTLTEACPQLAQRLVKETEIDAVLAPRVACGFQNAHVAKPGHLIEQEQNPPAQVSSSLVYAVQQRPENNSYALGRAAQRLDRHVDEDIELPQEQMLGAKRVSAHQAGERRNREPGRRVARLAIETSELLFRDVFEIASELC